MSSGRMLYTLVGFSAELDWRQLRFVKPIPPNRVCSSCGLVRQKTALLPCAHTLCKSCCEQCAQEGLHICPLDSYECQDDDVDWRDFPAEELLKREVKCWNEGSGCQHVATASTITQHYQQDCAHHSVCCPKCSTTVLCSGMVAHLKSGLCNSVTSPTSNSEGQFGCMKETAFLNFFRAALEKHAYEVKQFLERIADDISTHANRLNERFVSMNSVDETLGQAPAAVPNVNRECLTRIVSEVHASNDQLKQFWNSKIDALNLPGRMAGLEKTLNDEIGNATRRTEDSLSQIGANIVALRAEMTNNDEKALSHIKKGLRHAILGAAVCVFFVKNVKFLQSIAMNEGLAKYESEKVQLRGYSISPGVCFKKKNESVKLCARIQLHMGGMDDVLSWPFEHTIRLSVMHPDRGEERVSEFRPHRSCESYRRPTVSSNSAVYIEHQSLDLERLVSDGYVMEDQLRIKWELLP